MSEDTAIRLIEAIDIDHSGDVDEHEFVAWMELNTSQLKTAMIVGKILLGLGQIMSKQPETLKEQFPGPCLLYTSPSPRDATLSRMPSSA